MIELERIRAEKEKMEAAIASAAQTAVAAFKESTGITPNSIDVHMIVLERLGTPDEHIVSHVTAEVRL